MPEVRNRSQKASGSAPSDPSAPGRTGVRRRGADVAGFTLADQHTLPEFDLVYRRPPHRVARIPTRIRHIDTRSVCWLNALHPKAPLRFEGDVVLDQGCWAVWFIANGASHDLGKVYSATGRHTGYYVDVLEPVRWEGAAIATLTPLTDLFLDLWIAPDGRWQVLDEPEFAEAVAQRWISQEQADHARRTLDQLVALAEAGRLVPPEARDFLLQV